MRAEASLNWSLIFQRRILECIAVLRSCQHISFIIYCMEHMVPECGITTFGLVLMVTHEQVLGAVLARVDPNIFSPPVFSGERPLMSHAEHHVVFQWGVSLHQELLSLF